MQAISCEMLHATCVAIDGHAVLLSGASGMGKSDLALRLIDRGAVLVSDDYTLLAPTDGRLVATAPATIAGKMEVRGIGIVAMPHVEDVPVALLVELADRIDRMPDDGAVHALAGVDVPAIRLIAHEASAPIKVELALREVSGR
ncbi:MAG: HPr kinase/phosphorylase [Sphingobium sp.]